MFFTYHLARSLLVVDSPLEVLSSYLVAAKECRSTSPAVYPSPRDPDARLVFDGEGRVGSGTSHIRVSHGSLGYYVRVDGCGDFAITPDGAHIVALQTLESCAALYFQEVLLGPLLVLALAMQSIYCLHASACSLEGRAVAFLGVSGTGKSTLARYLASAWGTDWLHVADDVMPVTLVEDQVALLPAFPQLKLPSTAQPASALPDKMPLTAIYLLANPLEDGSASSRLLRSREAMLQLAKHSVAARLFGAELLARHLEFCTQVATCVPIRSLVYPRSLAALASVRQVLEADLSSRR